MLHITNLSKSYKRGKEALKNIDIQVGRGEIVGIVGLNGAGKTTLMNIISGVISYKKGNVKVNGKEVKKLSRDERREIAYLCTSSNIYDDLTVEDNLEMYRRIYGISKEKVDSIVKTLNVDSILGENVSDLSTGMKKKVEIACVIMNDFKLLMLDEPTNGLDIEVKASVLKYFKDRLTDDNAILITSHNVNDIEKLCDRVYIIREGKIVEETTVAILQERAKNDRGSTNLEDVIMKEICRGDIDEGDNI